MFLISHTRLLLGFYMALSCELLLAQAPPPLVSPEIHEDRQVTLRLLAPGAMSVKVVGGEIRKFLGDKSNELAKADNGVWSLTIGPLPPGIYDYAFNVDGLQTTDPSSTQVFGNRQGSRGYLEVPGPPGQPRHDEWRDVPHGSVNIHWYSQAGGNARRRLHVYTPPAYFREPERKFPVLYLLHGSGDKDSHWMHIGRANVIADNRIADRQAAPMIIVMPDGHAPIAPIDGEDRLATRDRANAAFQRDLLEAIIPLVEANYRILADNRHRAIAGLSMGGGQALRIGLNHPDKFAHLAAFSAGIRQPADSFQQALANSSGLNRQLRLLWIGCGKEDGLLLANQQFHALLDERQIKHTWAETEGGHTWSVWRQYLHDLLPQLFRE